MSVAVESSPSGRAEWPPKLGPAVEAEDELRARAAVPATVGILTRGGYYSDLVDDWNGAEHPPRLFVIGLDGNRSVRIASTAGVRWPLAVARDLESMRRSYTGLRADEGTLRMIQNDLDRLSDRAVREHRMWFNPFERRWVPG